MQIVLDTCALIAFVNGEPMQAAAMRAIRVAQTRATAWVPSVTATEIARKVAAGRLQLGSGPVGAALVRERDEEAGIPGVPDLDRARDQRL